MSISTVEISQLLKSIDLSSDLLLPENEVAIIDEIAEVLRGDMLNVREEILTVVFQIIGHIKADFDPYKALGEYFISHPLPVNVLLKDISPSNNPFVVGPSLSMEGNIDQVMKDQAEKIVNDIAEGNRIHVLKGAFRSGNSSLLRYIQQSIKDHPVMKAYSIKIINGQCAPVRLEQKIEEIEDIENTIILLDEASCVEIEQISKLLGAKALIASFPGLANACDDSQCRQLAVSENKIEYNRLLTEEELVNVGLKYGVFNREFLSVIAFLSGGNRYLFMSFLSISFSRIACNSFDIDNLPEYDGDVEFFNRDIQFVLDTLLDYLNGKNEETFQKRMEKMKLLFPLKSPIIANAFFNFVNSQGLSWARIIEILALYKKIIED